MHPDKELVREKIVFDKANRAIQEMNDEVAFLRAKRPCPIEPVLHKDSEEKVVPKGMLDKINEACESGTHKRI